MRRRDERRYIPQYGRVLVFPIKSHKFDNIPKELRNDLMEVLAKDQKSKKVRK